MNCLAESALERLALSLLREPGNRLAEDVGAHLAACHRCQELLSIFQEVHRELDAGAEERILPLRDLNTPAALSQSPAEPDERVVRLAADTRTAEEDEEGSQAFSTSDRFVVVIRRAADPGRGAAYLVADLSQLDFSLLMRQFLFLLVTDEDRYEFDERGEVALPCFPVQPRALAIRGRR